MAVIPLSPLDLPTAAASNRESSFPGNQDQPARLPLPPGAVEFGAAQLPLFLPPPVEVLGLPITPWRKAEVVQYVDQLIQAGRPSFFITANLHYARLTARLPQLKEVNKRAAFIVADGMPLLWVAQRQGTPLPERVTGADLIWDLSRLAAEKGYSIFLLGGLPGVAEQAAERLQERFPQLMVAGTAAPQMESLDPLAEAELLYHIRMSGAQLLFAALGQPKGEIWLSRNMPFLNVPVAVQIGAALDFVAGRIRRAPLWLQKSGLEWLYRVLCEPRRLAGRYLADGWFFLRQGGLRTPRKRGDSLGL